MMGGAVTHLHVQGVFLDCVFDSNRAVSLQEVSQGKAVLVMLRSGLGGAVLAYRMANETALYFEGCTFANNSAVDGGAIALGGAHAILQGCTFKNNLAAQSGTDVYATAGTELKIKESSIQLDSPTVLWERANASQCICGEYFGAVERLCRRCPPASFSLQTHADASTPCMACPQNAQVSCM
jgi:hypothetical protein